MTVRRAHFTLLVVLLAGVLAGIPVALFAARAATRAAEAPFSPNLPSRTLAFADSKLRVIYDPAQFAIPEREIDEWVLRSARATAAFFGRFPTREVTIAIVPGRGRDVQEGEATYDPHPRIRIVLGRETSAAQLKRNSTMVHEMAHLGFPDMDEAHLWLHEGLATYVEAVARAQAREIAPAQMWGWLAMIAKQGLPGDNEKRGLERTKDEDRRYYGGALYWLTADIEIRQRTNNRFGARDAIRAILASGGTLAVDWTPQQALRIGDDAVGVPVLTELFATWRNKPVAPDLDALWQSLGVEANGLRTTLVNSAPLAGIRRAITAQPKTPVLLRQPALLYEAKSR